VLPSGRRARVRGLQCFGTAAERVEPGSRCAVNLQGVELGDLARGMLITRPGALAPCLVFDAELRWLAGVAPLEQRADVEVLAGATHRRARLTPIGTERILPGEAGFARLHLEGEPLALLPGERFVVRGFARSPGFGSTLGGGRVLDVAPPRRRRSDPAVLDDLRVFAAGDAAVGFLARVERAGFAGVLLADLARETGLDEAELLARFGAAGERVVASSPGRWLAAARVAELEARVLGAVRAFHEREPLRPGVPRAALAGALPADVAEGALECVIARLAAAGRLVVEEDRVRLPGFAAALGPDDARIASRLRADAVAAGLEPPTPREWSDVLGVALPRLRELLAFLEREGTLVRAPGDVFFERSAVEALRARILAHFESHDRLDTPTYKQLIGTTRKWAVPLMEFFDEAHLTARRGEARVLRRR
jgi:selenocysteine-specific elongation factor